MDNRLQTIGTKRPGRLRKQDLPDLASALIGYWKGYGVLDASSSRNIPYVRIHGANFDVLVTWEDWEKLLPHLGNLSLSPLLFPSPRVDIDPRSIPDHSRDFGDPTLYAKTLGTLYGIFPDVESYPTQGVPQPFSPLSISGLTGQWDGSRPDAITVSGSDVTVWKDNIRGVNAFQANPLYRPTLNPSALNGLPGVVFDGTQWLDLPLQALQDWSVLIVGKYQLSATQPVGGFMVAAGFEDLGSGLDCYIKQNDDVTPLPGPKGRLSTWVLGDLAPISPYNDALAPNTFGLLYWNQASKQSGGSRARIGLHPDVDLLSIAAATPYDLSQEGWDPTKQLAGNPSPIFGALGRYSGPLSGGPTFYLVGTICEILLYNRVLYTSEYSQLASFLNTKWGVPL